MLTSVNKLMFRSLAMLHNLKGHSGRKLFFAIFPEKQKKKLADLKTNFTKFELSTTFRYRDVTSSVARRWRMQNHWLVKYAKSHAFCAFEADFM